VSAEPTGAGTKAEPLDPAHAARALELASDREQVFELLLRAVRSRARFAALLSVHADHIRGRRALADRFFDVTQVQNVRIERHTVHTLESVVASRAPMVGTIATGEPFIDGMLEALGGLAPTTLVLPVTIGERTVALLVAHRGGDPLGIEDLTDIFPLTAAANIALGRVLAGRSTAAAAQQRRQDATQRDPTQTDGYEVLQVEVDTAAGKRKALATYRKAGDWQELAETIRDLIRSGMETGDPDEDEQLDLLIELGNVEAQQLMRPDRAIEAWRSAQSIDAANPRILDALEALFAQQGRWGEHVDSLEKRVALAEGRRAKVKALLDLAAMAHERLDDDERAVEAYERVLELDPENAEAQRALEELYAQKQQWEPLVALLLEKDDPSAFEQVARIYEERIRDARAAFLVWLTVMRRDPTPALLVEHLDRLATIADAWAELAVESEQLAAELAGAHPEAAASLYHLVGRWQRDRLANHDAAIASLDRALKLAPTDVDTLYELLDLLRSNGRWTDLAAVLRERAQHETAPGPRSELYSELGDVYETRLDQPEEAIDYYQRALVDEPESMTALVALHRCYLATSAWEELGVLLPRLIEVLAPTAEHAVIVDLYVELGNVLGEHLGKTGEAVDAFREALAIDPGHAAALEGLATTGHAEVLLDATEASVDAASREEQLKRYPDLASAWHDHGRYDRAIVCWEKLLALDPKHVAAHHGLVRTLRASQQWGPLVVAMHALQKVVVEPHERMELLLELAATFESPLHDLDGASASYREVLAVAPHHHGALDALARIYDSTGRPQQALELLTRMLDSVTDPKPRADLLQRIGHVHLSARDAAAARLAFVQALALDMNNARAREGMARAHVQQGEHVAAGEELLRAAQLSTERADIIRCLLDAAWLYMKSLDDTTRARECLHKILELDPDHVDAKQGLAELLSKMQQWETLWPHLEQEVDRVVSDPNATPGERIDIYTRAARCAVELDKLPMALELYDAVLELEPSPAIQLERADALYRSQQLEAAAAAYQTVLAAHTLGKPQQLDVYRRLATIYTALGKPVQAGTFHKKALDIDPAHRDTLADLTELYLSQGLVDDAIGSLRTLAANATPTERAPYLERIGDLYRDKLQSVPKAMSTYLDALEHDPSNRRVLQRLLDLQTEQRQWQPAVETITRFLQHEKDPARRGAYFLAAAEIRRMELKDPIGALADYESALDELFRAPKHESTRARAGDAFRAIGEMALAEENYKYLEQSHRRMIKRLDPNDSLLLPMWDALGDIYRTHLQLPQSAVEAYEVAHSLDPHKSAQRSRTLAELYSAIGSATPTRTSLRAAKLVADDPTNPDAYRAVGRTAFEAGRIDEAWCVSRALVFLKQANPGEQALYEQYKSQEARKATGIIDEDAWALVRHPDESQVLCGIFALIWEGVAASRGGPAKSFELKAKERMPVEHDSRVVAKIFRHAARLVNVSLPEVYVQPRRPGRLMLANVLDKNDRLVPTIIVGRDLMTGYRDTELAAVVGSMIALLRPAYYLKLALPSAEELAVALAAAAQVVGVPNTRPELEPHIAKVAPQIAARLTQATGTALRALLARLANPIDLTKWRNAVDAAAQRAGLLVAGELAATCRMLASDQSIAGGLRPNQRVQDLVAYSVSPNYFKIRQHLGIAIG
jgi:tetratricopeptide (TPR) repeat protein